ncbi:MAG TPA: penicillin-binding protein [Treponemataceae bacterium]|mgnify:FL=1|jgi:cell division protein FtsI (penicillin-binding protein 3)|nr:penicillin-binding protein [Treponemataceae bacterium]
MQINNFSKKRFAVFIIIIAAVLFYILFSYAKLAFLPASIRTEQRKEVLRGSILDRNGKTLAVKANFYHLAATPSSVQDPQKTAAILAPYIGRSEDEIFKLITRAGSDFVYLKKKIEQDEYESIADEISKNRLTGLRLDRIQGRVYPENVLASQVIGFMGDDGVGLSGIEYSMQSVLSPSYDPLSSDNHGNDIYLTIDANLQYKLEQIARSTMEKTQAESLMLIAAHAKKGEILSYISLPSANLNTYSSAAEEEKRDLPSTFAYEPGSVFKVFSVASFIETGAIKQTDMYLCDGKHEIHSTNGEKVVITCLDHHGWITAREALQYSCNDALAQMSEKIDTNTFLSMIKAFGFTTKTGVELPYENPGAVRNPNDRLWSARSKPTISIGQEISVSALQMVQAGTALANNGIPLKLSFISQIASSDGTLTYQHTPVYKEQILSESTARYILSCMQTTAQSGTGSRAALGDVSIGVKTGTAQMSDKVKGGYSTTDFLSNCIAIFPIEDPQIILYIVISKAQGETYAGRIVAPVIADAADVIIDHLGLARSGASSIAHTGKIAITSGSSPVIGSTVPNFTGIPKRLLIPLLDRNDLRIIINGDGWVYTQNPEPGTPVTENMLIELYLQ